MALHFPIKLSHTDQKTTIDAAKKVVLQLKPDWGLTKNGSNKDQLHFEYFTEGITNTILSVWSNVTGPDDRVLMRIYGEKTDLIIDRQAEKRNLALLHRHGCAAPLLGTFENGIVYGYIPGCVLNIDDVRDAHLAELIAKRMALMHTVKGENDGLPPVPVLTSKITAYIANMPSQFEDEKKQQRYNSGFPSKYELLSELASIREKVEVMKSPVVFCHNDLLIKNLIYDSQKDIVHFIDYEYADYNYQAFDIANHFCEYAGVENVDFARFPDEKYQKWWLMHYLNYWREFTKAECPTESDVDVLYAQVNVFAAVSHFWWSIWAIIQARYSTIDFDFLQYGINRMSEYKRLKARYWNLSIK